ncbi:hypothetical protein AAFF_G00150590 [Aldrovandia affinis]|uniref:Nuclear receptor 2C2-associated protein n=1 Tax=Aldrovandia affinis TaxID=143900 RepID=A0AAD7RNX6_9TELE|nr:hypothetical protein AAFF_G00150590 [Aldrovandia affinis]
MAASLICSETVSRVSSVLHRDVRQFGKKYMFDSNEETCWNSDQGGSQWVVLEFPQPVRVSEVKLEFQGGFSGKTCRLEGCMKEGEFKKFSDFYPENNNSLQISFAALSQAAVFWPVYFQYNLLLSPWHLEWSNFPQSLRSAD